jgi:hypothetical protein
MAKFIELSGGLVIETEHPEFHAEGKILSKTEGKEKQKAYAKARLLEMLKHGDTVYTVLRHVSTSGMSRRIDLYTVRDNRPQYLSGYAATVTGWRLHDNGGIVVGGCGMDMGFHLVYTLSSILFRDNPIEGRNHSGYELRHEWL